ncbi:MAG: transcriptional regulator [Myxococcales bacterium]|nr:transcriptional regulator [Myxococcales bacterium]
MITSRLTSKSQTTLPKPVRVALQLRPGDAVCYRIEGTRIVLTKVEPEPADEPFSAFDEWDSDADRKAYADL